MTKKRLEQYSSIKAEIKKLEDEIKEAKIADREKSQLTDTVTGSYPEYPFTKHTVTIKGVDYGSDLLTRRLKEKAFLLDEERTYIEKWLDTVEDSQMRTIIRMKFVKGLTWQQIATELDAPHKMEKFKKDFYRFIEKH